MLNLAQKRIIIPLDVANEKEALELVEVLKEHVGLFKIGLELLNSVGIEVVKRVIDLGGEVFLDGKFNDIPNTVAGASRSVARLRVKMFTMHIMGGLEMMKLAAKATEEESSNLGIKRPLTLGVTILTSIDQIAMNQQLRIAGDINTQVVHMARLAFDAGLDGVVASPHEVESIKKTVSRDITIVTPGVRPKWALADDQKRMATPREAILRGASYLVIGRPITKPPSSIGSPVDAAKRVAEEIEAALERKIDQ